MAVGSKLPGIGPFGIAPSEYDQVFMQQFMDRLEQVILILAQPAQTGYAMTNVTVTRALDADSTTTAEVADVLGTLIDDMKAAGRLSK
jgi:hypothetical protein